MGKLGRKLSWPFTQPSEFRGEKIQQEKVLLSPTTWVYGQNIYSGKILRCFNLKKKKRSAREYSNLKVPWHFLNQNRFHGKNTTCRTSFQEMQNIVSKIKLKNVSQSWRSSLILILIRLKYYLTSYLNSFSGTDPFIIHRNDFFPKCSTTHHTSFMQHFTRDVNCERVNQNAGTDLEPEQGDFTEKYTAETSREMWSRRIGRLFALVSQTDRL